MVWPGDYVHVNTAQIAEMWSMVLALEYYDLIKFSANSIFILDLTGYRILVPLLPYKIRLDRSYACEGENHFGSVYSITE